MQSDRVVVRGRFSVPSVIAVTVLAAAVAGCVDLPTEGDRSVPQAAAEHPSAGGADPQAVLVPSLRSCRGGTLSTGALFQICIPLVWHGGLVVWAPGYAAPQEPLAIRDTEIGGRTVSEIVNGLGFAFATTSFHTNGLIPQG